MKKYALAVFLLTTTPSLGQQVPPQAQPQPQPATPSITLAGPEVDKLLEQMAASTIYIRTGNGAITPFVDSGVMQAIAALQAKVNAARSEPKK